MVQYLHFRILQFPLIYIPGREDVKRSNPHCGAPVYYSVQLVKLQFHYGVL